MLVRYDTTTSPSAMFIFEWLELDVCFCAFLASFLLLCYTFA
jgi:hypothetical protein